MAETTVTLQQIRRAVAAELGMPFFRKYGGPGAIDASSSATLVICAELTQKNDYWKNQWFYHVGDQLSSLITGFVASSDTLTLEQSLTSFATNDAFEIHDIWNAYEIHNKINEAIRLYARVYSNTVTDQTLILEDDQLKYDISSLASKVWFMDSLWLEDPKDVVRGAVSSATSTTVTLDADPGTLTTSYYISIYAGTGSGQLRSVVSNANEVVTVSAWTTNPDSTSKYALWDASEEVVDWFEVPTFHTDSLEYPDNLYLNGSLDRFLGLRFRIEYQSELTALTAEADTVAIPLDLIKFKVCSLLHGMKISDVKADQELHYAEYKRYEELADKWLNLNAPHVKSPRIRSNESSRWYDSEDPLNWNR